MGRTLSELITSQVATGATKASFTTAASVLNAQALVTIPANTLVVGDVFRVKVQMGISNVVTAQPTFSFQVMMGSVIAYTTGAITTNASAHTLIPAELEVTLKVHAIGSGTTAKFMGIGRLTGQFVVSGTGGDSAVTHPTLMVPVTAPALGTGFNSTVDQVMDFFVACQTSDPGNAVAVYNYTVEKISYDSTSLID